MDYKNLIAIDIHTHAEVSCRNPFDNYGEEYDRAADKFFGSDRRPTIDETVAYYREKKIGLVMFTVDSESQLGRRRIPNEEIADAAKANSDMMIAFASIDPHKGKMGAREAERLIKENGIKGFKFHPTVQGYHPYDKMAWPIYDVTSPSLRLYPQAEAGGEHRLVASNAWGLATSAVCTVSVVAAKPIVLANQPNDALIAAGIYHNVSANAYGTPPFGYQWLKDGAAIPAANDYYFEFGSARPADSGGYRLVVTNAYGACTSRVAQVTVSTNLPAIAQWTPSPDVLKAEPDGYVSFYGDASGPQPLTYSWRQVGSDAELSAYNNVSFDAVDPTNSGLYYFIVTNNNGAVTSRVSVLAVSPVTLLGLALDAPQQTLTNDWESNQWAPDVTGTNAHDGWCAARTPSA